MPLMPGTLLRDEEQVPLIQNLATEDEWLTVKKYPCTSEEMQHARIGLQSTWYVLTGVYVEASGYVYVWKINLNHRLMCTNHGIVKQKIWKCYLTFLSLLAAGMWKWDEVLGYATTPRPTPKNTTKTTLQSTKYKIQVISFTFTLSTYYSVQSERFYFYS